MRSLAKDIQLGEKLYEGKAKSIFAVQEHDEWICQQFKNSLTALNGKKTGSFERKGQINRDISSLIFQILAQRGINSHWVSDFGEFGFLTQKLRIIPLEVVVRNIAAGSLAQRLGWSEGTKLPNQIVEFYYKNDALGDPLINDDHIGLLKICDENQLRELRQRASQINLELLRIFSQCDLDLVDFKLEFGLTPNNELLLADEISPDTCRLWDKRTREKLDKDRFRKDLGRIEEAYVNVLERLQRARTSL